MIYIFRKEMKKWQNILWVVFVALAASGVSFMFFKPRHRHELQIASVNGQPIRFDEFHKALADLQERLNALRPYAAMYGMSEEVFINTFFGGSPEDLAIRTCIREKLIDGVKNEFNIQFDEEWFKSELIKTLPHLTDETGHVNMDAYNGYLQRMSITPAEYEQRKEEELKRELFNRFVQGAAYIPSYIAQEQCDQANTLKKFKILEIPQTYFLKLAEQKSVTPQELEAFYVKHQDDYRLPEKRKARYWLISPADYASKIEIDEQTIQNFYDKNKSNMFRIPPKVNVRHLLIKNGPDALTKINDLATKVKAKPAMFGELVRVHSQDEKTAKAGGVTGFFEHGAYDAEFEKAAFRLKTPGEVSDVVKTAKGYELVQLVERIQASEKPLSVVRDEIVKTLRTKKTALALRSDLERVVRGARDDQQLVSQFATGMNLKAVDTAWLTNDARSEGESVEGLLGKKLFGKNKQSGQSGYFPFESKYVLYQLVEAQKSVIQPLGAINAQVTKDYYNEEAESKAKATLKELKGDLLDKKTTLAQAEQRFGGKIHVTGALKSGAKLVGLESSGNLNTRIFELVDRSQVLTHMTEHHCYLVQLDGVERQQTSDTQALAKIIKQEKFRSGSLEIGAFIASLERNATISEVDKKMIDMGRNQ
ncbi:MAG: peptidylprolyl isomerase [Candidatus Babeliales bacterium]